MVAEAVAFAGSVCGLITIVSLSPPTGGRSFFHDCLASGSANGAASAILNPMDISKTRMQVQVRAMGASSKTTGILHTMRTLHMEGGVRNLWLPGLTASMMREMVGGSIRGGMYIPIRNVLGGEADGSMAGKAAAGLLSGFLGGIISNPLDIIKIRCLADGNRYPSALAAPSHLLRDEGLSGCWRGVVPSVVRAALINMGYLASYDHAKHSLIRFFDGNDGPQYHLFASLVSGIVATTVAAPFDMLKTRVMTATQTSSWEVFHMLVKVEGPASLFRGWFPAYLRLGPHSLLCFPMQEQIRAFLGLGYL